MGCIQEKQKKVPQKSQTFKYDVSESQISNPSNLPSTPTFKYTLEFELLNSEDLNSSVTFGKAKNNPEKLNSSSETLQDNMLEELNNSSEIENQIRMYKMTGINEIVKKISKSIVISDDSYDIQEEQEYY